MLGPHPWRVGHHQRLGLESVGSLNKLHLMEMFQILDNERNSNMSSEAREKIDHI